MSLCLVYLQLMGTSSWILPARVEFHDPQWNLPGCWLWESGVPSVLPPTRFPGIRSVPGTEWVLCSAYGMNKWLTLVNIYDAICVDLPSGFSRVFLVFLNICFLLFFFFVFYWVFFVCFLLCFYYSCVLTTPEMTDPAGSSASLSAEASSAGPA